MELPKLALNPTPFHSPGLLYITKGTNDIPSSTCDNVCFVCKLLLLIYAQYFWQGNTSLFHCGVNITSYMYYTTQFRMTEKH